MSLKEEILSNIPSDLNQLEIARYLYIELGKRLSFSTKFNNTTFLSMAEMRNTNVNINTFGGNQVNCIMWSSLYSQLLNSFSIKNNIIKQGHDYVEFFIDGVRWCADATYGSYTDLARIHNNDETSYFGPAVFQKNSKYNSVRLDEESINLIKSIDKKIGYNKQLLKLKEFLRDIRLGNTNIEKYIPEGEIIEDKLIYSIEFLFSKIGNLKTGYYESKDFVRDLMLVFLNEEDIQKVKGVELKRTSKDKEVDIVQCLYVHSENKLYYYLLSPNLPIKKVTEEEILKLAVLGYGIDEEKTILGIDFPRNFVPGKISTNNIVYKLQRKFIPEELKVYDSKQYDSKLHK